MTMSNVPNIAAQRKQATPVVGQTAGGRLYKPKKVEWRVVAPEVPHGSLVVLAMGNVTNIVYKCRAPHPALQRPR